MTLFSSLPGDEGLPGRERALAMVAVMTSTTMAVFDGAMVNIALPDIARELQVSAADAVWVANGYLLAAAMTLAIFAALAGRLGFRTLFAAGVGLFTLASLGCALADSLSWLVAMRFLQGIGGAATLSIAPAILRTVFPNRLLGRILGMNALLIATSTAVAPVLGGALLAWLGWPWLFAINLAPGALALWLTLRTLPQARRPAHGPFDVPGALLSALMLGAVVMAPDAVSLHAMFGFGALAALSGAALVWRLRRAPEPLLPPQLFASPPFYPGRAYFAGVVYQPGNDLCGAAVSVSERVWLQRAERGAAFHRLAGGHYAGRPLCRTPCRPPRAGAYRNRRACSVRGGPRGAGAVARAGERRGYQPARIAVRPGLWRFSKPE